MDLPNYLCKQLKIFFPDSLVDEDLHEIKIINDEALECLKPILLGVKLFGNNFNKHHSLQYATYLYILSNLLWKKKSASGLADKIFCLNKALNSIEINYAVRLPELFFLSHTVGTVLGQASYGNGLVIFQNVTVGRVGDKSPTIGKNVVLYPQVIVSGNTKIGDNCVISAGCHIHNLNIPDNTIVFNDNGELVYKPSSPKYIKLYLKLT